ncbi:MAG: galactose oxidase, partial [Sphingobacteriales bacterium]
GFTIGAKCYVGTGYSGSSTLNDFWEYDIATNTWTQKANYPGGGRLNITGFSIGNKGYFGCGWNSAYKNDLWEYDPATDTWTQKASLPSTARWGAVGFSIGTKGYIGTGDAAGNGTSCLTDFWEWDQGTNTWTQKANFIGAAVYGAAGFSIGTKGYIGTGYSSTTSVHNEFYEWDQATNTWSQKASFGGAARYQGTGFAIGTSGYIGTGSGGNDFWRWDQATNTWAAQPAYPGAGTNVCVGLTAAGKGFIGTGQTTGGGTTEYWQFGPGRASAVPACKCGRRRLCCGIP